MLVAWRYRKRDKSFIQGFNPSAWIMFYLCFLVSTLAFWDVRYLLPFFVIALFVLFTSQRQVVRDEARIYLHYWLCFHLSVLTFLTGRGGVELYKQEHLIREFKASFSILGWTPALDVTVERVFFASQSVRARIFHCHYDYFDPVFAQSGIIRNHIQRTCG